MKKKILFICALSLHSLTWSQSSGTDAVEINSKVSELLSKMTVAEKVGQMTQITVTIFEDPKKPGYFDAKKLRQGIQDFHIGSILNVPNPGASTIQRWQETLTAINKETAIPT